jgi:hypothetical protein
VIYVILACRARPRRFQGATEASTRGKGERALRRTRGRSGGGATGPMGGGEGVLLVGKGRQDWRGEDWEGQRDRSERWVREGNPSSIFI